MDQAELDKSMKLLELVENDVGYVVASSYLPDSASTPVKGVSNIGPRGLISHIRARIAQSIKAEMLIVTCASSMSDPPPPPADRPASLRARARAPDRRRELHGARYRVLCMPSSQKGSYSCVVQISCSVASISVLANF